MPEPVLIAGGEARGKLAFVFPGGGSQYVGMGQDVYDRYPSARRVFEEADQVLGFCLSGLCFEGPEAELTDTVNAQPATVTTSAALLAVLRDRFGPELSPDIAAGHSTGQYTALLAAGALDLRSGVPLVRERGRLMKEAGDRSTGAMTAVLGMGIGALEAICEEVGEVWVSNDNAPGQIVLAGTTEALRRASQLARRRGARKVIPLAVNIASHSPLMASATASLGRIMSEVTLRRPQVPVVVNTTASPMSSPEDLRQELVRHLTSRVRWAESVRTMIAAGVRTFVEIGPKDVLSGLIRRIDRNVRVVSIGTVACIEALEVGT